jgi:hypothetical protein
MAESLISYQVDLLKVEIETINTSIRQMDEICKNIKQWAITLWTATVGGAIATEELRRYLILTAALPILFWFVDTWYRRIQRHFIWRSMEIGEFLNSDDFATSVSQDKLTGFWLFDPSARRRRVAQKVPSFPEKEFEKFIGWSEILWFRSLSILYGGLIAMSVAIWLVYLSLPLF